MLGTTTSRWVTDSYRTLHLPTARNELSRLTNCLQPLTHYATVLLPDEFHFVSRCPEFELSILPINSTTFPLCRFCLFTFYGTISRQSARFLTSCHFEYNIIFIKKYVSLNRCLITVPACEKAPELEEYYHKV